MSILPILDKKSLGLDSQNEASCIKQKVQQWVCFYNVFCLLVEPTDTAKDTAQWVFCLNEWIRREELSLTAIK
jgi:hypothetical protein